MDSENSKTLGTLKAVIQRHFTQHGISVVKMVLFGSRALHCERTDSDWDLMVIADRELSFADKWAVLTPIKRELAELGIPNDIVVKSEAIYRADAKSTGSIAYYIDKQGVAV